MTEKQKYPPLVAYFSFSKWISWGRRSEAKSISVFSSSLLELCMTEKQKYPPLVAYFSFSK
jgi:hypothetical protein